MQINRAGRRCVISQDVHPNLRDGSWLCKNVLAVRDTWKNGGNTTAKFSAFTHRRFCRRCLFRSTSRSHNEVAEPSLRGARSIMCLRRKRQKFLEEDLASCAEICFG